MKTRVGHVEVDTPDVYIGRRDGRRTIHNSAPGESWGNPYRLSEFSRGTSIWKFAALLDRLCEEYPVYRLHLCDLGGKVLGCYCRAIGESEPACHGDVLAARPDALARELRGGDGTCTPGEHCFVLDGVCGVRSVESDLHRCRWLLHRTRRTRPVGGESAEGRAMSNLDWPEQIERTPPDEREPYPHGFDVTRSRAFDSILEELRKMDARNVQLDTGAEHQVKNPNKSYADASFDDPGVVVRYELDGAQHETAMDKWDNPRDNARAIALTFDAVARYRALGVETIESEFSSHRVLPPGDAVVTGSGDPPHEMLGVAPDADDETVRDAARS